jgi:hypothetical protein
MLLQALETDALRPELWEFCLRLLHQTGACEGNIASVKRALMAAQPTQNISGSNVQKSPAIVSSKQVMRQADRHDIVNIVIPIYDGFEQTKACIESVIKNTKHKSYHLVLVDDASPNQRIKAWLHSMTTDKRYTERITLITHSANQGFIGAVNRGLALNPERDVVLLNADTTVSGNWLVRLKAAAYAPKQQCRAVELSLPLPAYKCACTFSSSADRCATEKTQPRTRYYSDGGWLLLICAKRLSSEGRLFI